MLQNIFSHEVKALKSIVVLNIKTLIALLKKHRLYIFGPVVLGFAEEGLDEALTLGGFQDGIPMY